MKTMDSSSFGYNGGSEVDMPCLSRDVIRGSLSGSDFGHRGNVSVPEGRSDSESDELPSSTASCREELVGCDSENCTHV